MAYERETHVALTRCVSIMTLYHNGEQSPSTKQSMASEIRAIAGSMDELKLGWIRKERQIALPVEEALLTQFGPRVGEILNSDFLRAFQVSTEPGGAMQVKVPRQKR